MSGRSNGQYAPDTKNVRVKKIPIVRPEGLPTDVLQILSLDPGGTTGWSYMELRKEYIPGVCVFDIQRSELKGMEDDDAHLTPYNSDARIEWFHGQIDCLKDESAGIHAILRIINSKPGAAVSAESFQLRKPSGSNRPDLLSPERINAVLKYEMAKQGRTLHMQSPAFAKSTAPDHRLRTQQVYTSKGNLQHARDADRHAILMCRRCMGPDPKNKAFRYTLWPHIFNEDGSMK